MSEGDPRHHPGAAGAEAEAATVDEPAAADGQALAAEGVASSHPGAGAPDALAGPSPPAEPSPVARAPSPPLPPALPQLVDFDGSTEPVPLLAPGLPVPEVPKYRPPLAYASRGGEYTPPMSSPLLPPSPPWPIALPPPTPIPLPEGVGLNQEMFETRNGYTLDPSKWTLQQWTDYNGFRAIVHNHIRRRYRGVPLYIFCRLLPFHIRKIRSRRNCLGFTTWLAMFRSMPDLVHIQMEGPLIGRWVLRPTCLPLPPAELPIPEHVRQNPIGNISPTTGAFEGPLFKPKYQSLAEFPVPDYALVSVPTGEGRAMQVRQGFAALRGMVYECLRDHPNGVSLSNFRHHMGILSRRMKAVFKRYRVPAFTDFLLGMPDLVVIKDRKKGILASVHLRNPPEDGAGQRSLRQLEQLWEEHGEPVSTEDTLRQLALEDAAAPPRPRRLPVTVASRQAGQEEMDALGLPEEELFDGADVDDWEAQLEDFIAEERRQAKAAEGGKEEEEEDMGMGFGVEMEEEDDYAEEDEADGVEEEESDLDDDLEEEDEEDDEEAWMWEEEEEDIEAAAAEAEEGQGEEEEEEERVAARAGLDPEEQEERLVAARRSRRADWNVDLPPTKPVVERDPSKQWWRLVVPPALDAPEPRRPLLTAGEDARTMAPAELIAAEGEAMMLAPSLEAEAIAVALAQAQEEEEAGGSPFRAEPLPPPSQDPALLKGWKHEGLQYTATSAIEEQPTTAEEKLAEESAEATEAAAPEQKPKKKKWPGPGDEDGHRPVILEQPLSTARPYRYSPLDGPLPPVDYLNQPPLPPGGPLPAISHFWTGKEEQMYLHLRDMVQRYMQLHRRRGIGARMFSSLPGIEGEDFLKHRRQLGFSSLWRFLQSMPEVVTIRMLQRGRRRVPWLYPTNPVPNLDYVSPPPTPPRWISAAKVHRWKTWLHVSGFQAIPDPHAPPMTAKVATRMLRWRTKVIANRNPDGITLSWFMRKGRFLRDYLECMKVLSITDMVSFLQMQPDLVELKPSKEDEKMIIVYPAFETKKKSKASPTMRKIKHKAYVERMRIKEAGPSLLVRAAMEAPSRKAEGAKALPSGESRGWNADWQREEAEAAVGTDEAAAWDTQGQVSLPRGQTGRVRAATIRKSEFTKGWDSISIRGPSPDGPVDPREEPPGLPEPQPWTATWWREEARDPSKDWLRKKLTVLKLNNEEEAPPAKEQPPASTEGNEEWRGELETAPPIRDPSFGPRRRISLRCRCPCHAPAGLRGDAHLPAAPAAAPQATPGLATGSGCVVQ